MFCSNCGSPIPEGGKFCLNCGSAVAQQPAENEVPLQQADETVVLTQAEAAPIAQPAEETFSAPVFEAPKKKPLNLFVLIGGIVVALAAVVALVLNLGTLKKTFTKTFASPEKYMQQVYQDAVKDGSEDFAEAYGTYLEQMTADSQNVKGELKFVLTDDGKQLLATVLTPDGGVDEVDKYLGFINDLGISMEMNTKKEMLDYTIGLIAGGETVPVVNAIMDMAQMKMYLSSSHFTSESLYMDMSYNMPAAYDPEMMKDLVKVLPDEETVNKLLNKYSKVVLAELDDVDKETTTLSVGDVEQKVTELTCNLSQKDLVKILCAVMEEVKDDDDIRKIVKSIQSYMEEKGMYYEDEDIYETMIDSIDEMLDSKDEALDNADTADMLTLTTLVNNKHEITGFSVCVDDSEVFTYGCAFDGKEFATEIKAFEFGEELFTITGEGTKKKGIVNARYAVSVESMSGLTIEVSDFDEKTFEEDGYLNGTFEIIPSKDLLNEILGADADEMTAAVNMANPSIMLVVNAQEDTAATELYVCASGNKLAGIVVNATLGEAKKISVPSNATEVIEGDEFADWLASFDLTKLESVVEKLNLPDELSEMIDTFINEGGFGAIANAQNNDVVAYSAA